MVEKLGYSPQDRLLIVNADDFGMCHSGNLAIRDLLGEGVISSATVMVPCPWSLEAARIAAGNPAFDVGIHLTFTSEWETYKWGPVAHNGASDSLVTAFGHFPQTSLEVEKRATPEQVKAEIRAQVERGIAMGIDPTHLDNHMGSLYGIASGRDFLEETLDICEEYRLPYRFPRYLGTQWSAMPDPLKAMHAARVQSADRRGVVLIDYLDGLSFQLEEGETYPVLKQKMEHKLRTMQPGVTEMIIHPFYDTDELKAIMPHHAKRQMEYELFRDDDIKRVLQEENIKLINWRLLRDLMRGA